MEARARARRTKRSRCTRSHGRRSRQVQIYCAETLLVCVSQHSYSAQLHRTMFECSNLDIIDAPPHIHHRATRRNSEMMKI